MAHVDEVVDPLMFAVGGARSGVAAASVFPLVSCKKKKQARKSSEFM